MNILTFLLPTLLLAGLLLLTVHCATLLRPALCTPEEFPAVRREKKLTRRDALIATVLTLCYAVVVFTGLGDRQAPERFCHFADRGNYTLIEFREAQTIGSLRYYTGLHTGKYYAEVSTDGEEYVGVGALEQSYSEIFKWIDASPDMLSVPVKFLRLVSTNELYLGELAIYDEDGRLIPTSDMIFDAGTATLFDEQSLIPEEGPTYRNSAYFDEIYHVRTAQEHIQNIYPYELSHPPLGKLIIGLGIRAFGLSPFGWRFSGTLIGVLMLPILYVFLKKLFGSTMIAAGGTALLATDFMHFVQTRIATIDSYAVFFILLMYLFMYLFVSDDPDARDYRPLRQMRNLFLSGLFFGLGAASKWTCLYAGAGLAVIWLLYWIFRGIKLHKSERRGEFLPEFASNVGLCLVFFVLIPVLIYYLCYIPYGKAKGMSGLSMLADKEYLRIVLDNQKFMFTYHSGVDATHPYSSRWYQWLLNMRPILYYLDYPAEGSRSSFGAFLNPIVCWGGLIALVGTAVLGLRQRDKKALFLVLGYLAQLLPWVAVKRIVFEYHYFTCMPFLILCICYVFDALRRVDPAWKKRVLHFAVTGAVLFVMFYPVLTGVTVPKWYYSNVLHWLPSWPF